MDHRPTLIRALQGLARPETDEYFLLQTLVVATRGTCGRRRVGCVLVDVHNKVLATGYNGVASGMAHCIDKPCPGRDLPSGTGLDKCEALHAEENALIQCTRPNEIHTVYCTASPCVFCVRRLMNTGAKRIVFAEEYPHPESARNWILSRADFEGPTWIHKPWDRSPYIASIPEEPSEPGPSLSTADFPSFDTGMQSLKAVRSPGSKIQSSPTDPEEDSSIRPG